jgi:leucyl-tRNA synthetase/very-short-patch-repair endonuclease
VEYNFREVEAKWRAKWASEKTYKSEIKNDQPKCYVLDMFPYPSGAGLHVGHPLGYIASDIYARYKRLKGFNVLHPMGYDSFGLPAEQYAIQTGQHPAITTEENINRYREQLDKIGFSFDWEREVRTSDPAYYKWTQWVFIQLFNSWYDPESNKAEAIESLIQKFKVQGSKFNVSGGDKTWDELSEKEQSDVLMEHRLAYLGEAYVNWCPALGTVLANDEVKDGVSERGGHPVEKKLMKQWSMRITAYAQRLLDDLEGIDWTESIKESQRYWIGRSEGSSLKFNVQSSTLALEVFTTRPDTIFGVSFMVIAPEHELVAELTSADQKQAVEDYLEKTKNRSERERMADVKNVTGVFTGAYAIHPFSGKQIPVWIGDYVLAGYGTGAVMAVAAHDSRDYAFAKQFNLPILPVVEGGEIEKEAYESKTGKIINSDFLDGLEVKDAMKKVIAKIEDLSLGKGKINYRLRDAVFGRQRYWGEPIPVYYKNGIPQVLPENELPLVLPEVDKFLPTEDGEPPLARAKDWAYMASPQPSPKEREMGDELGFETADKNAWSVLKENARDNRKNPTEAEERLWSAVRNNQLGFKFRRQHSIDQFIADFACLEKALIVEVDGEIHNIPENKEYDEGRTFELKKKGFEIIRFTNEEVLTQLNVVIDKIKSILSTGSPLFRRGAGGEAYPYETTTMPGWAGSSWYFLRYMDPKNDTAFASKEAVDYWQNVDLYIGGSEHATGHLLYVRFWTKFLNDRGFIPVNEPAKKLINQGMIQGRSNFVYRINGTNKFVSFGLKNEHATTALHVDVNIVDNDVLDLEAFKNWREEYKTAEFILEDGKYVCGNEVEKMSKSKWNVVSPDLIVEKSGADVLRLYEMFLGPLELSKPWNTNGISGVSNFIRKLWRLYNQDGVWNVSEEKADKKELKSLHKTIRKIVEDIERFSFNTSVSNFMICVNELTELKCNKREVLEPLAIIISPYAPHVAEELWEKLGHTESIFKQSFPAVNESYLVESSFNYPISFNGKTRFMQELDLSVPKEEVEKIVMAMEKTQQYLEGKTPKKVIVVPGKIVNIVL